MKAGKATRLVHVIPNKKEGTPVYKQSIVFVLAGFWIAGGIAAQQSPAAPLPPDIDPVTLTRLPQLTRADLDDEGKAIYDKIVGNGPVPTTGPVAVSLYSPKIAQPWSDLNGFLRYNGDLSPRHTEVAICVAAFEIKQQYEYSAHEPAALRYGAPQAVIDTIKYDREPVGLSPEETVIIKVGRQIMREHKLDSDLYAEAVRLFGRKGLVEMVTVMGDYVMVGMVLTAIDQHLPPNRPALLPMPPAAR
jgi:alkylhydroperoxidase family enzyme